MPTKEEVIKKYGKPMWNKMVKSTWLDCITVTIHRALCVCRCEKCGCVTNMWIGPPFDWNIQPNCECGRWKGLHIEMIIKSESDIPQSDIDRAYRAAKGEKIHHLEWD
jgi:hypothetical protein